MKVDQKVAALLQPGEKLREQSDRKSRIFQSVICLASGICLTYDAGRYAFGNLRYMPLFVLGLALIYAGIWFLVLCERESVYVTNQRVLYLKVNLLGLPGRVVSIPMEEIESVRICKSTVTFRAKSYSASIMLNRKNKGSCMLPFLENGQYIQEEVAEVLKQFEIARDAAQNDLETPQGV